MSLMPMLRFSYAAKSQTLNSVQPKLQTIKFGNVNGDIVQFGQSEKDEKDDTDGIDPTLIGGSSNEDEDNADGAIDGLLGNMG